MKLTMIDYLPEKLTTMSIAHNIVGKMGTHAFNHVWELLWFPPKGELRNLGMNIRRGAEASFYRSTYEEVS